MSFLGPEFLGFPPFGVVGTLYIRTYVGILCKIWQLLTGEFLLYQKRRCSNKEIITRVAYQVDTNHFSSIGIIPPPLGWYYRYSSVGIARYSLVGIGRYFSRYYCASHFLLKLFV